MRARSARPPKAVPVTSFDRRLLAVLLVFAVLPFGFTGIALAPYWLAVVGAAVLLWYRSGRGLGLSTTAQNLAGVLIVVAVLIGGGIRVGPLRPLGHLLLLLTVLRALMVDNRRQFRRFLPLVGLVWVVSVASSTHVTLVLYLVASAMLIWWTGMRILLEGLLEANGQPLDLPFTVPRPRHAIVAGLISLLLAVPMFLLLPRLRSPWIAGQGGLGSVTGFTAAVQLAQVGTIQRSREVALVLRTKGERIQQAWTRVRATAFDLVRTGEWTARRNDLQRLEGLVWLAAQSIDLSGTTKIDIELVQPSRYLFLPAATVALRCPVPIFRDPAGGFLIGRRDRGRSITYSVWLAENPLSRLQPPVNRDTFLPRVNPAVADLARTIVAEQTDPAQQASAIVTYMEENFAYSLSSASRFEADPVAWFLLRGRQGHCELFAGSMAVLLRHLGVPARMVGGYNGGTASASGQEVVVRQTNAHTWVEVWLGEDRGWTVFDPTPAEGIPGLGGISGLGWMRWLWESVQVIWDRWVISFGMADQAALLTEFFTLVLGLARQLRPVHGLWLLAAALLPFLVVKLIRSLQRWRRSVSRRRQPAAAAVARLARRLRASGVVLPVGVTVRRIGQAAACQWSEAAPAAAELVDLAERELYSQENPDPRSAAVARALWTTLRRAG